VAIPHHISKGGKEMRRGYVRISKRQRYGKKNLAGFGLGGDKPMTLGESMGFPSEEEIERFKKSRQPSPQTALDNHNAIFYNKPVITDPTRQGPGHQSPIRHCNNGYSSTFSTDIIATGEQR